MQFHTYYKPSPSKRSGIMLNTTVCSIFDKGYRYGFNGMERDGDMFEGSYATEYRMYDSRLGRWLSVDPKYSYSPGQSPYSNNNNCPTSYKDPKGDFGFIGALIGGAIGAVKEIGSQVISNGMQNMRDGKGFFDGGLKKIDWVDVGTSAGQGALIGSGAGILVLATAKVSSMVINSAFDASLEAGSKNIFNGKKSLGNAATDLIFEGMSIVGDKSFGKVGSMILSNDLAADVSKRTSKRLLGLAGESVGDAFNGYIEGAIWKETPDKRKGIETDLRMAIDNLGDFSRNGLRKDAPLNVLETVKVKWQKNSNNNKANEAKVNIKVQEKLDEIK